VKAFSGQPAPEDNAADPPGTENWPAVGEAISERLRELGMPAARLARETGLSETTIRCIGRPDRGHRKHALVAISAVLRWRPDHLLNILRSEPEKNVHVRPPGLANLERLVNARADALSDDLSALRQTVRDIGGKIGALPVPDDIDADYSPQYVKLARVLRGKITSGELSRSATLRACDLATGYGVSAPVAGAALEMLAANRYVARPERTRHYRVTGDEQPAESGKDQP
jgi:hypothetical protein